MRKKSKLQIVREKVEQTVILTNEKIEELGRRADKFYDLMDLLQQLFDNIKNVPKEHLKEYDKLKKIRANWKEESIKIENKLNNAKAKDVGFGLVATSTGVVVATLGPTMAMGIATTFGVASTGTAISALSGVAATNAALAWLGGGALAVGGGGMVAGEAFLAMAGPVGWAVAGVAIISSSFIFWKINSEKNRLENINALIGERDIKSYKLAIVELNERILRINEEIKLINDAIIDIATFGVDYKKMNEAQQYKLGSYVNLMEASTQLLVNPIIGLAPKFTEADFDSYISSDIEYIENYNQKKYKNVIISLANLLYKIKLDEKDKKIILKSYVKNEKFLHSMGINAKELNIELLNMVVSSLNYKYKNESK